ncbi:MAG: helicase C-terminal domain-containing protein [Ignisphaera sp.]
MDYEKIYTFPYKIARIGQLELVNAILNSSKRMSIINICAPTGFGKTVSVLYSAIKIVERGDVDRILYLVRTRNELDPVIREARNIGVEFTVLYSGRRMCPYAVDKAVSNEGFWTFCSILRIQGRCQYYSRAIGSSIEVIKRIVNASEDHFTIARNLSSKAGVCPYFSLLSLSNHTYLTIATYPYLFKERILLSTLSHINPQKTLLIIDEAHNIHNIGGIMGDSIKLNSIRNAIEEILKYRSDEKDVIDILSMLGMIRVDGRGFKYIGKDGIGLEKSLVERISSIATDIAMEIVSTIGSSVDKVMATDLKILYTSKFLETLFQEDFDLFALTSFNAEVELHALPVSFDPLRKMLEQFKLVIMMSGTPPSKEFLSHVVSVRGDIADIDVEEFGAPNYIRENSYTLIFAGSTTSYRARDEYMYRVYAELIEKVHGNNKRWVTMVIYPSYEVMWSILKYLNRSNNSVIDGGEPLPIIRNLLFSKEDAILHTIAGGRLAEGVELVKDGESIIKCVIAIGMPYPQPDDYIKTILRNTKDREDLKVDYYTEVAITRVMQAIGRAIRSENDHALIILADRRYKNPLIIRRLKLNIKKITASIEDVKRVSDQFYNQLQSI